MIVSEEVWQRVQKTGVSEEMLSTASKERDPKELFLKSVYAYQATDWKRALNMGLRFYRKQPVLPEGFLKMLGSAAGYEKRLDELFEPCMEYAYSLIDKGELDRALNYMRLPFVFPGVERFIYDLPMMSYLAEKLSHIAEALKDKNKFNYERKEHGAKKKLAVVTPMLVDNVQAWSKTSVQFARYYDSEKYELKLYYMDPGNHDRPRDCLWQYTGGNSREAGAKTLVEFDELNISYEICPSLSYTDSAIWLAGDFEEEGVDAVLFQGSVNSNIMWLASSICAVPVKVQLCVGLNMYQEGLDATIYMNQVNLDKERASWRSGWGAQKFIGGGADLKEASETPAPDRAEIDIPEGAVTFGMLSMFVKDRVTEEYMDCVIEVLKECPEAYFICMGSEDVGAKVEYFQKFGVADRCRWLGLQTRPFIALKFLDFYFNEIPKGGSQSIRECMCCGIPALAMRYSDHHPESVGADIIGEKYAVLENDPQEYVRRAIEWVKSPQLRQQAAADLLHRAEEKYSAKKFVAEVTSYMAETLID